MKNDNSVKDVGTQSEHILMNDLVAQRATSPLETLETNTVTKPNLSRKTIGEENKSFQKKASAKGFGDIK